MKLIYEATNEEVKIGDKVKLNDRFYFVIGIQEPHSFKDTGRVILKPLEKYRKNYKSMFYPENIGAIFINEREETL